MSMKDFFFLNNWILSLGKRVIDFTTEIIGKFVLLTHRPNHYCQEVNLRSQVTALNSSVA